MCGTCGCGEDENITYRKPGEDHIHDHSHGHHHHDHHHDHGHTHSTTIDVQRNILSRNDLMAERNKGFFEALGLVVLNLVSSPGSGKTSLLERTIKEQGDVLPCAVIEGDQQTMNDANRIKQAGAPVVQVNTGNGCHLDALMVNKAAKALELKDKAVLFIENVGNLVCPSLFNLGETKRVVIISVTEGHDKPAKYPTMFESAQLCLVNKTDLLPYVDFDMDEFRKTALAVNHQLEIIELSAKSGEGMNLWYAWIRELRG